MPNITMDDYFEQQRLDSVDFAKIDLEGHEIPDSTRLEKMPFCTQGKELSTLK